MKYCDTCKYDREMGEDMCEAGVSLNEGTPSFQMRLREEHPFGCTLWEGKPKEFEGVIDKASKFVGDALVVGPYERYFLADSTGRKVHVTLRHTEEE